MPTLVLIRHAKAEPARADDHSRALAPRGLADAAALRSWLLDQRVVPDRVIVSTALRTRQTWDACSVGTAAASYEDRVYEASVGDLLDVLRETPAATGTVVLVGHNPGVEALAWSLDDSDAARDRTNAGMGTSGAAVFDVTDWSLDAGELRAFR